MELSSQIQLAFLYHGQKSFHRFRHISLKSNLILFIYLSPIFQCFSNLGDGFFHNIERDEKYNKKNTHNKHNTCC